jgi:hypothetical protein
MANDPGPDPPPADAAPIWVMIVGVVFGFLTLAFLMRIVLLNMTGSPIPCAARFPIVAVISLCAAFSMGFLGGYLNAQGAIPLPFVAVNPFQVGAGGGIAAFLVFMLTGYWLYVANCHDGPQCNAPQIESVDLQVDGTTRVALIRFDDSDLPVTYRIKVEFSQEESFDALIAAVSIDNPDSGEADVGVPRRAQLPCWMRLAVYDATGHRITECISEPWELSQ